MIMEKIKNNRLKITFLSIFIVLIIIVIAVVHSLINNATISIQVTPSSAKITLDGRSVSSGDIKVKPGTYTVSATKDGFEAQEVTVEAKANQVSSALLILTSNSEDTKNWYQEHEEDRLLLESISGTSFDHETNIMANKYPVINFIPYNGTTYDINYGTCENSDFCIMINALVPNGFNDATNYLRDHIQNIGAYQYIYTDFENPFRNIQVSDIPPQAQSISSDETQAVKNAIQNIFTNYKVTIKNVETLNDNIIATIGYSLGNEDFPGEIIYRFIIQKTNNSYLLITRPEIILTYHDNQNIPHEIIDTANNL